MTSAKIPPKPGKDTIYIDVEDEITAIIDKVESAKQKVVALVLPKRAAVLQSIVNMRLLKRNAEKAAKNVVLITSEEALLPLAGAVGLHVARNLQSKPEVPSAPTGAAIRKAVDNEPPEDIDAEPDKENTKLDYHRAVGELAAAHGEDESAIALGDEDEPAAAAKNAKSKTPKDKKLKVPNFDRFRLLLIGGITALVLLIIFIILAVFVLPKATITIKTSSSPVSANLTLHAADSVKTLDEAGNAIPAVVKTTKQTSTQSVPATGQQNNGTKATGSVTMSDCVTGYSPPSSVPAGTGISVNGLTYITQQDTKFGAGVGTGSCINYQATSSTPITAQAGGAKYNVPSGTDFAVSSRPDVDASGSANGGTDNIVTVVSQGDLNNASSKLTGADNTSFTKNFESQLASQGLYVVTGTLKAADPTVTASPALGQPASNTTVTTTINYTVIAIQKSDLRKIITDALNKQIDKSKQKISDEDVLKEATIGVQSQASPNDATLSVSIDTTAVPIIDVASIQKESAGQKNGDIQSAVGGLPGVKSVNVKLSPFWVSKAPSASKIKVVQEQVASSGN